MTAFDRRLMLISNLLVGGTGIAYGLIHWLGKPPDEYSLYHPWFSSAQHLHILTAPLLVFAIGHLYHHHGISSLKAGTEEGRRSGIALLILAFPMIFSGYFLQLAGSDNWRIIWIGVHVATSLVWLAGFAAHLISHARAKELNAS